MKKVIIFLLVTNFLISCSSSGPKEEMIISDINKEFAKKDVAIVGYWEYSVSDIKIIGITKKDNIAKVLVNFTRDGVYYGGYTSEKTHKFHKPILIYEKFGDQWVYKGTE